MITSKRPRRVIREHSSLITSRPEFLFDVQYLRKRLSFIGCVTCDWHRQRGQDQENHWRSLRPEATIKTSFNLNFFYLRVCRWFELFNMTFILPIYEYLAHLFDQAYLMHQVRICWRIFKIPRIQVNVKQQLQEKCTVTCGGLIPSWNCSLISLFKLWWNETCLGFIQNWRQACRLRGGGFYTD